MINVIYRLSDNGYNKPKFPNATKLHCFKNMLSQFHPNWVHVFVDETNLLPETRQAMIDENNHWWAEYGDQIGAGFGHFEFYTAGSSAASWRHVFDFALNKFRPEEYVYFVEDDYLHLEGARSILTQGLQIADYVSLYDHNDKYIPASQGGNPFIDEDAGEVTKVFRTKDVHWKLTNSTTMTFATTVAQLREDEATWREFTQGSHPNDFSCFLKLRELGRSLITPIPGYSTHCEPRWASPGTDWDVV